VIRFENVVKRFGRKEVLSGVSFSVAKGEIVALLGPSGTGKSVLLKHVVRLLEPTSGTVTVAPGAHVGYLFQGGALLAWLTVWENVALPLRETTDLSEEEIARRVDDALAAVELTESADKYPAEISGGMVKRAGLARAVVCQADVVLYDEPTSGLDPVTSSTIHRLIKRLNATRGITSVVVTHDVLGAMSFADRVLMLKDGHVLADAKPADFVKSDVPEVREFIASAKGEDV